MSKNASEPTVALLEAQLQLWRQSMNMLEHSRIRVTDFALKLMHQTFSDQLARWQTLLEVHDWESAAAMLGKSLDRGNEERAELLKDGMRVLEANQEEFAAGFQHAVQEWQTSTWQAMESPREESPLESVMRSIWQLAPAAGNAASPARYKSRHTRTQV